MLSGIFNALINHTALELSCPALTINVQSVTIEIYVRVKKSPLRKERAFIRFDSTIFNLRKLVINPYRRKEL